RSDGTREREGSRASQYGRANKRSLPQANQGVTLKNTLKDSSKTREETMDNPQHNGQGNIRTGRISRRRFIEGGASVAALPGLGTIMEVASPRMGRAASLKTLVIVQQPGSLRTI